jgi:hypothetical protein
MVEVVVVLLPQLVVAVAAGGYELFLPSFYLFFFLACSSLSLAQSANNRSLKGSRSGSFNSILF